MCLPGPVVCMVGEGPLLGLVFHRSAPAGARQFMAVGIWRISADGSASNVTTVDLPLGEDAVLSWVGFSSNHVRKMLT